MIEGRTNQMEESLTLVLPLVAGEIKPGDTLVIKSVDGIGENFECGTPESSELSEPVESSVLFINTTESKQNYKFQQVVDRINAIEHFGVKHKIEGKGAKYGRKAKQRPATLEAVKAEWQRGELSARKAGKKLGVSHHTFLKWIKE